MSYVNCLKTFLVVVLQLGAFAFLATPDVARAMPANFEQRLVIGGLKDPVMMAFAPDGRIFILERITGQIRIMRPNGTYLPTPFATLDVPPVRHRSGGLQALVFDPDFASNGYVYVFYTKQFPVKRHNRVSRLRADPANPDRMLAGSETVLMELPFNNDNSLGSTGSHNGAAMFFGKDGKLYFTTGDGYEAGEGYGHGDNVQSLSTYTGKLFRIERDGSIPTDNPFYTQTTGAFRGIYALGFRNPFSAAVHPETGELYIFDVGEVWGDSKDYIYRIGPGDNGRHDAGASVSIGTLRSPWVKTGSRVISGGAWYFANQFPAEYRGSLFVSHWSGDDIRRVRSRTDPAVLGFASDEVPANGPVYVQVGPDGALYYLKTTYETNQGAIYRIAYTGGNSAAAPVFSPAGGTFVASATVTLTTFTTGGVIRYTLDGSEPTASSPAYTAPLTLSTSATLRARTFLAGLDASATTTATFTIQPGVPPAFVAPPPTTATRGAELLFEALATGTPAPTYTLVSGPPGAGLNEVSGLLRWTPSGPEPGVFLLRAANGVGAPAELAFTVTVLDVRLPENPPAGQLAAGWGVTVFDGAVEPLADTRRLTASEAGTVAALTPSPLGRTGGFAARFEAYLQVPTSGNYTLRLLATGAARLRLGSESLLTATNATVAATAGLAAGRHAVTIEYFAPPAGGGALALSWSGPGLPNAPVPASAWARPQPAPGIFLRENAPAYLGFPTTENAPLPATLGATGAFLDVANLVVAPGLVPYDVASPLWSDGAAKFRWLSVPSGTSATYSTHQHWTFPPGTVFVKHFELGDEGRRLETRFTVVKTDGSIYGVTYRWRADQTEADLVPAEGLTEELQVDLGRRQEWTYPSRLNCLECHTPSSGQVLGARTGQLNGLYRYPGSGVVDNQVRTLARLGLLANPPADDALATEPAFARVDDPAAPLELRVRSYLEVNCASCHNPGNTMEGARFDARFSTPWSTAGLLDVAPVNALGIPGARLLKPQDPESSLVLLRLRSTDPALRMPPIGRKIVDPAATSALIDYLASLAPTAVGADVGDFIRRWPLDSDLLAAGGPAGTWRAGGLPNFVPGRIAGGLNFNGASDAVDLGGLDLPTNAFTVSLWMRADDFDVSDGRLISKATGSQEGDHLWMLSTLDSTRLRMRLRTDGVTTTLVSPLGTLQAGAWTHVAMTYDGARMALYRNGVEVASVAKTGSVAVNPAVTATLGNQPAAAGAGRPFDGLIDDVRIYARALSAAELAVIHAAPGVVNQAPQPTLLEPTALEVEENAPVVFAVAATDAEDGDVSASARWTSSLQGPIGQGARLEFTGLLPGVHRIAATVTDSAGSSAMTVKTLRVRPGFWDWSVRRGLSLDGLGDFDRDGLADLIEYGAGLDPTRNDPPPHRIGMVETTTGPRLAITFPLRADARDITYIVEGSNNLLTWQPLVAHFVLPEGPQRVVMPAGELAGLSSGGLLTTPGGWRAEERVPAPATRNGCFLRLIIQR
jgi:uncharacterized repeat protein (TIGR03806 family)